MYLYKLDLCVWMFMGWRRNRYFSDGQHSPVSITQQESYPYLILIYFRLFLNDTRNKLKLNVLFVLLEISTGSYTSSIRKFGFTEHSELESVYPFLGF